MTVGWLLEEHHLSGRVSIAQAVGGQAKFDEVAVVVRGGVIDEEASVGCKIRVEGEAKEALLDPIGTHPVGQVKEIGNGSVLVHGDDPPLLVHHQQTRGTGNRDGDHGTVNLGDEIDLKTRQRSERCHRCGGRGHGGGGCRLASVRRRRG